MPPDLCNLHLAHLSLNARQLNTNLRLDFSFFFYFFYFLVDRRPEGNPILHTSRNLEAQLFGQLTNTGAVNCDCQPANSGALEASSHANYSAMCDALRELNSIL